MSRRAFTALALAACGAGAAQANVDLTTTSCFAVILASRPEAILMPDVDLYLDGIIAGARSQNDPAWLTRFIEICVASPNTPVQTVLDQASKAGN